MLQEFLEQLKSFNGRLRNQKSVNVNDHNTKAAVINFASTYFNLHRSYIVKALGEIPELREHDERWQDLVRLAHGNNQRRTHIKLLAELIRDLRELSVRTLTIAAEKKGDVEGKSDLTPAESQLLSTLDALLPTAAASYRQGILDLRDSDRLSYRGTASEFRETLRETLDHLASDNEVETQPGFKLEEGQKRPTMKQKIRFILSSRGRGKTQTAVTEKSIGVIESLVGEVVRATYNRASLATHLETTREEVTRIKRYVDTILFDLLEISEYAIVTHTS